MLAGGSATYTITASNPGTVSVYNLSDRAVLPAGVSYRAGSTSPATFGEPTVLANEPVAGETTLIWDNVSDLFVASQVALSFGVSLGSSLLVGSTFQIAEGIYASSDPRTVPQFDPTTGLPTGGYDGSATTTEGPVQVSAIQLTHTNSAPKGEQLRGVHDNVTTQTLTVRNDSIAATNNVTVTTYLPATLEFLGCGGVDNTPSTFTGIGGASGVEYPGAPSLSATPAPPSCTAPTTVTTVSLAAGAAGSGSPAGVYTEAQWTGITLSVGEVLTVAYQTGVPLFANSLTFPDETTPSPGSLGQASNLDNNNGPVTTAPSTPVPVTSYSNASGDYQGPFAAGGANPVGATASTTVTPVDLRILKSASPTQFTQGGDNTWTLTAQSSEYRSATGVVVVDHVPDGMCPIAASGDTTCAPDGSAIGSSTSGTTGTVAGSEGSYTVTFAVGTMKAEATDVIKFVSLGLPAYSGGNPTVSGDGLVNHVTLDGTTLPIFGNADPSPQPVTLTPGIESDSAALTTGVPSLSKQIAAPASFQQPAGCTAATYATTPPDPIYGQGDHVCFRLTAGFPGGLDTRNAVLEDVVPLGATFDANATTTFNGSTNTLPASDISLTVSTIGSSQLLTWQLGAPVNGGGTEVPPGSTFDVVFSVTAGPPQTTADLTGNLAKLTWVNTAGQSTSLRSEANYTLAVPTLALQKGRFRLFSG